MLYTCFWVKGVLDSIIFLCCHGYRSLHKMLALCGALSYFFFFHVIAKKTHANNSPFYVAVEFLQVLIHGTCVLLSLGKC